MSHSPHDDYDPAMKEFLRTAADGLRRSASTQDLRAALCRYLLRGANAGFSTGALVDLLGVSSPSVLEQAGFSDELAEQAMRVLATISDEELRSAGP